jgi:hypothetical protein
MRKWRIMWPLYAGLMGFTLGASVFFGLYGRNEMEHGIAAQGGPKPSEESAKSTKQVSDEALAFYTLWLMAFTGVLAVATIGLGIATIGLYVTGEKQLRFGIRSSIRQGNSTKKSIEIAERALTELEAPFTAIKIIDTGLIRRTTGIGHDFGVLKFSITNDGRTPAKLVELVDKTIFVPIGSGNPPPINLDYRTRNIMPHGVISPPNNESQPFTRNVLADHMNELAADTLVLKSKAFFFYGFIRYETIFKQTYRMGFCYMFDKFSERWILTGEDNYNYLAKESG